jgi:nucleotide-binding universal stress UspA family protein
MVVATDGSDGSRAAVEMAMDWASVLTAELHGIYVVDAGLAYTDIVERALESEGSRAIAQLERQADEAGIEVITAIEEGIPHESICAYADENEADLIVVGSHGRDALERAMLGSVSERTVRTADQPVLVVRPGSKEE